MKVLYLRALLCRKLIQYLLHKPTFWGLWITFFLSGVTQLAWAQEPSSNKAQNDVLSAIPKGGLKIGDSIPEALWHLPLQVVNHPEGKDTITLNDYRGKLIILDFWATWCGPCIYSIKKLDSIQKKLGDESLAVIPVNTYDDFKKTTKRIQLLGLNLPSVLNTPILKQYFPHDGIPFQVWITGEIIQATPWHYYASEKNIRSTLNGKPVKMHMKYGGAALRLDPFRTLFAEGNGDHEIYPLYKTANSTISPYNLTVESLPLTYATKENQQVLYAINVSLPYLMLEAFKKELSVHVFENERMKWSVNPQLRKRLFSHPKLAFSDKYEANIPYHQWIENNWYSYQVLIEDQRDSTKLWRQMQKDISTYFGKRFGIDAHIENRPKDFLIVSNLYDADYTKKKLRSISDKWGIKYQGSTIKYQLVTLTSLFGEIQSTEPTKPCINLTGIDLSFAIDYVFPAVIPNTLASLNQLLEVYGLKVKKERREEPILIVREINNDYR